MPTPARLSEDMGTGVTERTSDALTGVRRGRAAYPKTTIPNLLDVRYASLFGESPWRKQIFICTSLGDDSGQYPTKPL
jgi:hypothetical protein